MFVCINVLSYSPVYFLLLVHHISIADVIFAEIRCHYSGLAAFSQHQSETLRETEHFLNFFNIDCHVKLTFIY